MGDGVHNMDQINQERKLTMAERMELTKPYNLFFTTIPDFTQTLFQDNSISFPDLLCPSLGALKNSLQINFMVDFMWLMEQYRVHNLCEKPITIINGDYEFSHTEKFLSMNLYKIKHKMVKLKMGLQHAKIGIYQYEDGSIRIVVSTANLYYNDWNRYCQGLWVSPALKKMPNSACSGPTNFKIGFLEYLNSYDLPELNEWIDMVKNADFGEVKVHFIASIPGVSYPEEVGSHLLQVGDVLSKYCTLPVRGRLSWPVLAQSSSVGKFGQNFNQWLRKVILRSLASYKEMPLPSNSNARFCFVYPTEKNVMFSHFGAEGGGCLPYEEEIHKEQLWLKEYLYEWKADRTGRSKAMPHFKSYCRVSPCYTKLAYFLLTSANLSKSAWGSNIEKDLSSYVRSYEAGVMFLPSFFDEEYFKIVGEPGERVFPFMYDLPLLPYGPEDEPWCN